MTISRRNLLALLGASALTPTVVAKVFPTQTVGSAVNIWGACLNTVAQDLEIPSEVFEDAAITGMGMMLQSTLTTGQTLMKTRAVEPTEYRGEAVWHLGRQQGKTVLRKVLADAGMTHVTVV